MTFSENIRAYTSRSFEQPFYVDFFTNVSMQWAIFMAEAAMWFVLFCPFVSDTVFSLEGKHLDWQGFVGRELFLVLCSYGTRSEVYRSFCPGQLCRGLWGYDLKFAGPSCEGVHHKVPRLTATQNQWSATPQHVTTITCITSSPQMIRSRHHILSAQLVLLPTTTSRHRHSS